MDYKAILHLKMFKFVMVLMLIISLLPSILPFLMKEGILGKTLKKKYIDGQRNSKGGWENYIRKNI